MNLLTTQENNHTVLRLLFSITFIKMLKATIHKLSRNFTNSVLYTVQIVFTLALFTRSSVHKPPTQIEKIVFPFKLYFFFKEKSVDYYHEKVVLNNNRNQIHDIPYKNVNFKICYAHKFIHFNSNSAIYMSSELGLMVQA